MANALAYKPKEKLGKFPQGVARIKAGKKAARITFVDDSIVFDNGDNSKEFDLKQGLPAVPHIAPDSVNEYFVKLNRDKDEVLSIGPVDGMFKAKVVDLSRRNENEEVAPYEIQSDAHPEWKPYLAFNAYFEIQKGLFKGVRISQFHHYKFTEGADGEAIWDGQVDNSKAKWLPKLVEFCEKTGCVDEPIEWPSDGNVLPELLDRILDADREVSIFVKNGYIESLVGSSGYDEDDDDELLEKRTRKAKAKEFVEKVVRKPAPAKAKLNGSKAKRARL